MKPYKREFTKLEEMPHINYGKDHELFDLELETFKDIEGFLKYLDDILEGKPKKDKYGNVINLKARNDKIEFIRSLKDNPMFSTFVKHKLSNNEKRLLNIIMKI